MSLENCCDDRLANVEPNPEGQTVTKDSPRVSLTENGKSDAGQRVNGHVATVEQIVAGAADTNVKRIDRTGKMASRLRRGENSH